MAADGIPVELWDQLVDALDGPMGETLRRERAALLPYLDQWDTASEGSAWLIDPTWDFLNANMGNFIDRIPNPTTDQRGGISWVAIIDHGHWPPNDGRRGPLDDDE